ncbi:MAG: ribonuclease Z [Ferruginibacter sp.]|nr:ribonuclease Z [Ferruginibacter sp.]
MLALTILGNNSAIPAFGRNPTAQILQNDDEAFLIDCGEGTQLQMSKYKIKKGKISHVFISHLHGDHYFGLIGLLTSMSLLNRTQDLHLYAPPLLENILQLHLDAAATTLCYKVYFHALGDEGPIANTKRMNIACFKVKHRIDCWGFLFSEKKRPRSIDPERVRLYEIPASFYPQLQKGEDYTTKKGVLIANADVTNAATKHKTYAYCADTIYDETLSAKIKDVDLLYHETTYLKDQHERAAARFHCTTTQAAEIAKKGGVKKLIIGHFSSKYEVLDQFLVEAKEVFEHTELALEGACYKI